MRILKSYSGVIYPATGARFLALFLDADGSSPLACTLYPRVNGDGCIFALPSQKGCAVGCSFCSVPKYFGNLNASEIFAIKHHLEAKASSAGVSLAGRHKLSFVKGGELFHNEYLHEILDGIHREHLDLKISTVFADTKIVRSNIDQFLKFCGDFTRERTVSLQFSALSSTESARRNITRYPLVSFREVKQFAETFFALRARKITMSFTATDDLICDPEELAPILPPEYFAVRIYPYKANAKLMTPLSDAKCFALERLFGEFGYTVVPCLNKYERGIGYFDDQNEALERLSFK